MEIKKIYTETVPAMQLIGKRYTIADTDGSGFGAKWGEFMQNGWFEKLGEIDGTRDFDCVGLMRMTDGEFEYWIGLMYDQGTPVPEEFDTVNVNEFEAAVFWIYGSHENGEIYRQQDACYAIMKERGWGQTCSGWQIERYNSPRFTDPDASGNVILDYYIEIAK
jgi:predicted transcriptional regulator YdeE